MDQSNLMSVFETCFWICLSFTILFLVISVILFFLFDIRTVFAIRTGRAKARTIKEMELANSQTGRLRVKGKTQTSKLGKTGGKPRKGAVITPPQGAVNSTAPAGDGGYGSDAGSRSADILRQGVEDTQVLAQGSEDTQVLSQGSEETQLLESNSIKAFAGAQIAKPAKADNDIFSDSSSTPTTELSEINTGVLSSQQNARPLAEPEARDIGFTIIKKVMLIHTEETI